MIDLDIVLPMHFNQRCDCALSLLHLILHKRLETDTLYFMSDTDSAFAGQVYWSIVVAGILHFADAG